MAVLMGKLKNAVNQTEDLDNLTIRKVYHKPQNVTEPQGKQQPAAAASRETEDTGEAVQRKVWVACWNPMGMACMLELKTLKGRHYL